MAKQKIRPATEVEIAVLKELTDDDDITGAEWTPGEIRHVNSAGQTCVTSPATIAEHLEKNPDRKKAHEAALKEQQKAMVEGRKQADEEAAKDSDPQAQRAMMHDASGQLRDQVVSAADVGDRPDGGPRAPQHAADDHAYNRAVQEAQPRSDFDARAKAADDAMRAAEEEANPKAEEEAKQQAHDEARRVAHDYSRPQAAASARAQADDEARTKAADQGKSKAADQGKPRSKDEPRADGKTKRPKHSGR